MNEKKFNSVDLDNALGFQNLDLLNDKYTVFKHSLLIRIMAIAGTLTALFATLDIIGLHDMGSAQRNFNYAFSLSNIIIATLLHKKQLHFVPACGLFLLLCYLGSISAVVNVVDDDFRAIWFFLTIFFAYMLGGVAVGYILTAIAVATLLSIQIFVEETYSQLSFMSIIIGFTFFSMSLSSFAKQMAKFRSLLHKQSIELNYLANKDPLTDVLNSKNHAVLAKTLLEKAKATKGDLSMLCVFIDNLPSIYQKHGAQIEAPILAHVEKVMTTQVGAKGDIAKVNKQEYCVLLPEFDLLSAKTLANQINESVKQNLLAAGEAKIAITLSVGVSTLLESDMAIRSMQVRADKALNRAKIQGGNKVFTHTD